MISALSPTRTSHGGHGDHRGRPHLPSFSSSVLSVLSVAIFALTLPGSALAQDPPPPKPPPSAHALLAEARFLDNCLDDHERAEILYRKALDAGLSRADEAEAQFGLGRARLLAGREDPGMATMEKLAGRAGDASLAPWPARARTVLDRVSNGEPAFATRPRGDGVFSVDSAGKPLETLLRELVPKTKVGVGFDEQFSTKTTVSVSLEEIPFDELMNKVVGNGFWRRIGDSVVVGEIAKNGEAFERRFSYDALKRPDERSTAGLLCTRRVSVTFPGTPLAGAIAKLNEVSNVKVELSQKVTEGRPRSVRAYLKDERLDRALDIIAVPCGCAWQIEGAKVVLYPRKADE